MWINDKNIPFVKIDNDILAGVAEKDWIKTVKNNLSTKFPNGVTLGKNVIKIDSQSRKEMTFSKYMKWLKYNNPQAFSDKLRATNNADEILDATQGWVSEGLNHSRKDDIVDFARGTVLLRIGANDYSASVIVGTHKTGKMILYDIIDLTTTKITKKETSDAIPENSSRRVERKTTLISNNSITEPELKVNTESKKSFALPEDVKAPLDTSDSIKLGTPSQYKASLDGLSKNQKKAIIKANRTKPILLTPEMILQRGRNSRKRNPLGLSPRTKKNIDYTVKAVQTLLTSALMAVIAFEMVTDPTRTVIASVCMKLITVIVNGFLGYKFGYENIVFDTSNYISNQSDLLTQFIEYTKKIKEKNLPENGEIF